MKISRIASYVEVVQEFASQSIFFHAAVATALGMHITDLRALRLLQTHPITATELAKRVGLTGPAVTALIDRLEKWGCVVRERDSDDRRKVIVRAVAEKRAEIDNYYVGQHAQMSRMLGRYSRSEFEVILKFLRETTLILEAGVVEFSSGLEGRSTQQPEKENES